MNRRQLINKILHDHIDVNKNEDYTNYKKLITAIEEWHESEVKKLPIHNVSDSFCDRCKRITLTPANTSIHYCSCCGDKNYR